MSELRQDPISGDWVIIAPGRFRRPQMLEVKAKPRKPAPKSTCPFEEPRLSENQPPIARYPEGDSWKIIVVPNKYPALTHVNGCAEPFRRGLYLAEAGAGDHELVITRDHRASFMDLDRKTAAGLLGVFQDRHRAAAKDPCTVYASTFFNYGARVGASIWHPHYQVMALPFVPPRFVHWLAGSEKYFSRHRRCVRCDIIKEERRVKRRIVAGNASAIAFAPFASKRPFEVSIFPKQHLSHFEETKPAALAGIAEVLQSVLRRMKRYANDPDLNFFVHDAPVDGKPYRHHHWHIEVMPSISVFGGFEYSTNVDINVVDPDEAAKILRGE